MFMVSIISFAETTSSSPHPQPSQFSPLPIGMYSMKRTCRGASTVRRAKERRSWFKLRTTTVLSLTGERPDERAASTPSRASSRLPRLVMKRYCSASSVSNDIFTRERPAVFKSAVILGRSIALVVSATLSMPGVWAVRSIRPKSPLRTVGSPPVKRICLIPSCDAHSIALWTSSRVRMLSWGMLLTPCSGMQ